MQEQDIKRSDLNKKLFVRIRDILEKEGTWHYGRVGLGIAIDMLLTEYDVTKKNDEIADNKQISPFLDGEIVWFDSPNLGLYITRYTHKSLGGVHDRLEKFEGTLPRFWFKEKVMEEDRSKLAYNS